MMERSEGVDANRPSPGRVVWPCGRSSIAQNKKEHHGTFESYSAEPQIYPTKNSIGPSGPDLRRAWPTCRASDHRFENAWAYTVGAAIAMKGEGTQKSRQSARGSNLLHPGLRRGRPQGGSRPRQPGGDAPVRRDHVLLFPRRPRVVRSRRGSHRHRPQRQPRPEDAAQGDPERPRQGRRPDHQPHQRLHLRADPVRLLHGRSQDRQEWNT